MLTSKFNNNSEIRTIFFSTASCFIIMYILLNKTISDIYMPDDYLLFSERMPMSFYLSQGRFIQALINGFYNISEINIITGSILFTPLFFLTTSLVASTFVTKLTQNNCSCLIVVLLSASVVTHPVYAMMAVYHLATVCFSVCMLCVYFFMVLSHERYKSKRYKIANIILIIMICGNYQPAIIICLFFTIGYSLVRHNNIVNKETIYNYLVIIIGVVGYAIITAITKHYINNNWDTRLEPVDDIKLRIKEIFDFIPSFFYKDWWIIPKYLGLSYTIMLLSFLLPNLNKPKKILKNLLLLILLLILTISPISVIKTWDTTPRSLFSISFLYISFCIVLNSDSFLKIKIICISIAILIGSLCSGKYLFQVKMESMKDQAIIYNIYDKLSSMDIKGKEIYIFNNDAISVAPWAINGLYKFYTNDDVNFIIRDNISNGDTCPENKKFHYKYNDNKIVFCLRK